MNLLEIGTTAPPLPVHVQTVTPLPLLPAPLPNLLADGQEYTNTCYAQVEGATVQCLGLCPCTDPVAALETGSGGTLLVPTDDALLAALEAINGTAVGSDWLGEPELLRELLARHIVLTEHQRVSCRRWWWLRCMRLASTASTSGQCHRF